MATVKKLGKGSYEVRWNQYDSDGKRHQLRKHFDRRDDADAFHKSLDENKPYEAQTATFSGWIDSWFEVYKLRVEATTAAGYMHLMGKCKKHFGDTLVANIKPSDIDLFYAKLQSKDHPYSTKPLSPSSTQRHHSLLHRAFEFAVRDGILEFNPCDRIDRPKSSRQEPVMPDMAEVQKRIDALHGTEFYLPVVVALMTGMRKSEVLGLKWSDVDYKKRELFIRRVRQYICTKSLENIELNAYTRLVPQVVGNIERDYPKAKKNHKVSISAELCDMLREENKRQAENRLAHGEKYVETGFMFVDDLGVPVLPNNLSKVMAGVCRYHDLRHLNGVQLLRAGHSVADVAGHLGHTTPQTTLKYYAHAMHDYEEKAADVMASVIQLKS